MSRTVLITGCSSGIGRLAAETFHREGWNVVATMRRPEEETELTQLDNALVARLDVTDLASIDATIEAAEARFGGLDVVVNNAGYGGNRLFELSDDAFARAMYDTNVFGVMNVCRAVLPRMRRQGHGTVINVTSVAGLMAAPPFSVYASTKFALQGLTEAMALEYRRFGIDVKTVAPGAYPTTRFNDNSDNDSSAESDPELHAYAKALDAQMAAIVEQLATQGGSVADPQEVADKILECATTETPVTNPVGADADMVLAMMASGTRQEFLEQLAGMILPPEVRSDG